MKFTEATAHAVSLLNILEESGATASDMMMVSNILSSLVKARQSSELTAEIQGRMKGAMDKKRDELLGNIDKAIKGVKKMAPKPVVNIDDLKMPKSKMN